MYYNAGVAAVIEHSTRSFLSLAFYGVLINGLTDLLVARRVGILLACVYSDKRDSVTF